MNIKILLAVLIALLFGCSDQKNTFKLKGEMLKDVELVGEIQRNQNAELGDITLFNFKLKKPINVENEDGRDCAKKITLNEIDLFYGGKNAFDGLENKELTLVGTLDCPRGTLVFRDIDSSKKDGMVFKQQLDKNYAAMREKKQKLQTAENCFIQYWAALNAKRSWVLELFRQRGYNEMQAGAMDIVNYNFIAGLIFSNEIRMEIGDSRNLDDEAKKIAYQEYFGNYTLSNLEQKIKNNLNECNNYFGADKISAKARELLSDSVNGNPHPMLAIFSLKN